MIASIIHRELLLSVVLEFMGDQRDENSHSWFGWSRQDHHIVQVSDDMEKALLCQHDPPREGDHYVIHAPSLSLSQIASW